MDRSRPTPREAVADWHENIPGTWDKAPRCLHNQGIDRVGSRHCRLGPTAWSRVGTLRAPRVSRLSPHGDTGPALPLATEIRAAPPDFRLSAPASISESGSNPG